MAGGIIHRMAPTCRLSIKEIVIMYELSNAVHYHFDALADHYNLECTKSSEWEVRFQNSKVFLQVLFDSGRSFEIGVEIGQIPAMGVLERPFNLAEILRLQKSPDASYIANLEASQPKVQRHIIARLAELTKKYAGQLLDGDKQAFLILSKFRDRECEEYALARDLRYARRDAESAWLKKDYFGVINIYKSLKTVLTPVEKRRLEFAEKHIEQSPNDLRKL